MLKENAFTNSQTFKNALLITTALECLNTEIDKGCEFPEALSRVLQAYPIERSALIAAYDAQ